MTHARDEEGGFAATARSNTRERESSASRFEKLRREEKKKVLAALCDKRLSAHEGKVDNVVVRAVRR